MNVLTTIIAIVSILLVAGSDLERTKHDHTLYEINGDSEQLRQFQKNIGSQWEGGKLLRIDEDTGTYIYWAFSNRTAQQSRAFMMPVILSGIQLNIETYDDAISFPEHRTFLDSAAVDCGLKHDPFLILPDGGLEIRPIAEMETRQFACAMQKVKDDGRFKNIYTVEMGEEKYFPESME